MVGFCVFTPDDDGAQRCVRCGFSFHAKVLPVHRACTIPFDNIALVGTELHAILRDWLGVEPTADCPCRSMAAKMDRLGPEWCESDEGMAEILGVMRAEHAKRREQGATILPWTDFGARQLVLLACRRARANAAG